MRACSECEGFVPASLPRCPHCDHHLGEQLPAAAPRGLSLRAKFVTGLMASSAAMTLMACYGVPCGADECIADSGDTGGQEETCDPAASPVAVEQGDLPTTVEGTLAAVAGSDYGSCGGGGDEVVYLWTPPAAGSYRLSVDSSVDTVLYVRAPNASVSGSCGEELACVDDVDEDKSPAVELDVASTDPLVVVVDAFSTDGAGSFTLTVEEL